MDTKQQNSVSIFTLRALHCCNSQLHVVGYFPPDIVRYCILKRFYSSESSFDTAGGCLSQSQLPKCNAQGFVGKHLQTAKWFFSTEWHISQHLPLGGIIYSNCISIDYLNSVNYMCGFVSKITLLWVIGYPELHAVWYLRDLVRSVADMRHTVRTSVAHWGKMISHLFIV